MTHEFKVPELGENIHSGTVAKIAVAVGDDIVQGQTVVELETDKAVVEVPIDVAGKVAAILIADGDEVQVGQTILTMEVAEVANQEQQTKSTSEPATPPETKQQKTTTPMASPASTTELVKKEPIAEDIAPAAPSVRRFAREIGIDIKEVGGSGPGGRISKEDVKNFAKMVNKQKTVAGSLLQGIEAEPLPDFAKWGNITRKPMSKVRQTTARHLGFAWTTIPHVTQFDKADISELEKLRKQYNPQVEAAGGKLTITAILVKMVSAAFKVYPQFNASIDLANKEIVYKHYHNIGIAVDTDRGLLVPVLRNVDRKNLLEIAVELTKITAKARQGKLSLQDMQGGNFSISNLGGIGGTGFTPVVNAPDVAILGVSRAQVEPVYQEQNFVPRLLLPLSLSYDHRLIDGADAARFLRWICEALAQPFKVILHG